MKVLYLDESGDHDLINISKNYPIFVLAGCIIDFDYHQTVIRPSLKELKNSLLKTDKVILHYKEYARSEGSFENMRRKEFRDNFYSQLSKMIDSLSFTLIACIIDKPRHNDKYGPLAIDPYLLSLQIIVERFILSLKDSSEEGTIIAESRGQQLDNELELAFLDLKIKGTSFLPPKDITNNITSFLIRKKEKNIAGLQLIDSLVTPIGRRYLGYKNYVDYNLIKKKFRRSSCGKSTGYGLIILPRK